MLFFVGRCSPAITPAVLFKNLFSLFNSSFFLYPYRVQICLKTQFGVFNGSWAQGGITSWMSERRRSGGRHLCVPKCVRGVMAICRRVNSLIFRGSKS